MIGESREILKEKKRLFRINHVPDIFPTPNIEWKRLFPLELLLVKWIKLSFNTHNNFREEFVPKEVFQLRKGDS